MVRELATTDEDFFTTADSAHIWVNVRHDWLLIIGKGKASVAPVNAIETDFEWETCVGADCWRRLANESDCGIEVRTHHLISESAVRNNTILRSVVEPCAEDFDEGATFVETCCGVHLENRRGPV